MKIYDDRSKGLDLNVDKVIYEDENCLLCNCSYDDGSVEPEVILVNKKTNSVLNSSFYSYLFHK